MRCPYCGSTNTQVKDSRPSEDHTTIRRRRVCADCGGRFTTFERVQLRELTVIKRSGRRTPFDRDKLMRSVQIALRKRPVDPERIERMVSGIVRRLENMGENDIKSETIGRLVMEALKALDDVAYVRFASVYKNFREAKDFEALLGELAATDDDETRRPNGPARPRPLPKISPSPYITPMSASDEDHMAQALQLARRGLGLTWPNPSVGSIVVAPSGEILARGWTAPGGRPHAEAIALEQAGAGARGATIYVTLEPCAHVGGRGPACADIIAAARPARAVIALRDPDPRTAGRGLERLAAAGIEVKDGVLAQEASEVALGHILRVTEGRPAVTLKLAVGADGLIPKGEGAPVWITGPDARAHGHLLRARHDAILVGRGTVLADNPSLTCRLPGMSCRSPVRVVLDRRLRTPPEARLFDDLMVPVWIICAADEEHPNTDALQDRGAEIVPVPVDGHGMLGHARRARDAWPAAASPACWSRAARPWRALFSMPI